MLYLQHPNELNLCVTDGAGQRAKKNSASSGLALPKSLNFLSVFIVSIICSGIMGRMKHNERRSASTL